MFRFQKLEVWKKSIEFSDLTLGIADELPKSYQFSLGEQLRRAIISISTNIAEGSGRRFSKEERQFFNIAKGSVYEVVSLLTLAFKRGLVKRSTQEKEKLYQMSEEIAKMLSGLIRRK